MPNIAALLKSEITRVARKEIRAEIESLRKAVSAQRLAIAALKREIAEVRKAASKSGLHNMGRRCCVTTVKKYVPPAVWDRR